MVYRRKQSRDIVITAPYAYSVTNEILVFIASPLILNGQCQGAIFFDMSLSRLAELVNQVSLFNAGYLFIVDGDGTTIAHPDAKYNGKPMADFLGNHPISTDAVHAELDGESVA
ncbi:cache domain-containing protein [Photobacterium lutimaris]|uniref:PDC sensor domain-containing protein n=1 Tax=Photobacterium lutimaris TaxID=388278 RepID=UPI0010DA33E7|nr:cache domain-containing protein [Photobacterium lutimaris]TDR77277.1 cache domain-containing protein [Photobacterium lutimaris]